MCYDSRLNLLACRPSKIISNDFICLGADKIIPFLTEKFAAKPENERAFYTYFLDGNIFCIIVFPAVGEEYIGAFVTQPLFIKTHNPEEIDVLLRQINPDMHDNEFMRNVINRIPVRPYESLASIGETLSGLLYAVFREKPVFQVLCGDIREIPSAETENRAFTHSIDIDENYPVRQLRFSSYLKLMECIQNGDTKALEENTAEVSNGNMPTHQLYKADYMRSLKNSYIKLCSMACYAAIEKNAPYYKMLDLSDEFIRQAEKADNAIEIFTLMKKTLFEFTRAVEISRIQTFSKPVRQALDYIHTHYEEKITLEMLAGQVHLSPFYLSTLIKKETGLMLPDNINSVRIEESKKLLFNKNISIVEVAEQVGFNYPNHFSTVFKKFTGVTPMEYVKITGNGNGTKHEVTAGGKTIPILVDRLRKTISLFPEIYDAARIVDPVNHCAWGVDEVENTVAAGTCYDFWGRNEFCDNCISEKAFLQNRTFMKIEKKENRIFFVLAAPKTFGTKSYVVEVLKDITEDMIPGINPDALTESPPEKNPSPAAGGDKTPFFSGRDEIEKQLPVCIRRNALEKKPFSIIVLRLNNFSENSPFSAPEVQEKAKWELSQIIRTAVNKNICLSGQYTGEILLIALCDTDYDTACKIAENIGQDFRKTAFEINGQVEFLTMDAGVKTLTEDTADISMLIKTALIDLTKNSLVEMTGQDESTCAG